MKDSPKQMGSVCVQGPWGQSVLPLGREIGQRWTAVPRAGHIGSEITHSIYGSPGVYRLTDLAIEQQTGRQTVGRPKFITRSASVQASFRFTR